MQQANWITYHLGKIKEDISTADKFRQQQGFFHSGKNDFQALPTQSDVTVLLKNCFAPLLDPSIRMIKCEPDTPALYILREHLQYDFPDSEYKLEVYTPDLAADVDCESIDEDENELRAFIHDNSSGNQNKELKMNELQNAATGGKNQDRTRNSVLRQMALLQSMSLEQLREKWLDLYGEEPPQYKKQFLIKRLAYRIQELFYGGLSEQAKVHLQQAAKEDPVATVNRRIPEERKSNEAILPGTRLVRVWNDRRYEVIVLADGYEFEGRTFRSLSTVAREITGTRWNGKVFFGLKKVYGRKAEGGSDA